MGIGQEGRLYWMERVSLWFSYGIYERSEYRLSITKGVGEGAGPLPEWNERSE